MGEHDTLFRRVFSVPAHAADELRSVLPQALVEAVDLSRLELLSGAFVSDRMDARYADLVFRAPLVAPDEDGQEEFAYIHVQLHVVIEHQSLSDAHMPLRAHEYTLGLWRQMLREEPTRKTLPPIITLVVHHGPGGWRAPRTLHEMVDGLERAPALRPYVPNVELLIDDLSSVDDAALRARPLAAVPKVAVWLLRDGRQVEALLARIPVWKDLLQEVFTDDPAVGRAFVRYISVLSTERTFDEIRRAILEHVAAAEAPLASIAEQLKQEGRQEGRQEGALLTLRQVLRTQLEQRFGALGAAIEARIDTATHEELQRAVGRVMVASDAVSVFASH